MSLTQKQIKELTDAYKKVHTVWQDITHQGDNQQSLVFELAAANGVLETLLIKHTQKQINEHEHRTTERL